MRRRFSPLSIIIFALIAIAILSMIQVLIIPIIVVAVIVFLYYFPPSRWKIRRFSGGAFGRNKTQSSSRSKAPKKRGRFKVIQGSKSDDPTDPPRYH